MSEKPDNTPAQIEAHVSSLLDAGQIFFARDAAAEGLTQFPDSLRLRVLFALALIRSGAVAEAVGTLKPILARVDTRPLVAAHAALQHAMVQAQREASALARTASRDEELESRRDPLPETLTAIAELVSSFEAVRSGGLRARRIEPSLLLELGELHLEAWQRTGDADLLETSRALLEEAFGVAGDPRAGAFAAAALRLLGEQRESHRLAREVLAGDDRRIGVDDNELVFRRLGARGLAALLADEPDRALGLLSEATHALGRRSTLVVPLLRLTRKLRASGVTVPAETDGILRPPGVVVFTGHMVDPPDAATERFPAWLEHDLRAEIAARLERMDVQIGYSGASCGSDLLFVESLLERDGEVNLVLPFDTEDYVRTCVAPGGARWERRFRNALRLAHSVAHATRENYLGHDELFRFQNQMLQGLSILRAQFLEIAPNLLAVWDMTEGSLTGGAAEFIDQWTDISRLQIIDIDDVREIARATAPIPAITSPSSRPTTPVIRVQPERTIRAMLFSDFVGYSKLTEQCMPHYLAFLDHIAQDLEDELRPAEGIETWGDAIFAVMPRASDLVRFAFALNGAIQRHRTPDPTRGVWLDTRISLHAGPVFPGRDPFTGRNRFTGTHINRAARLEPVTVPGQIYATQHFVALLAAEESQRRHEVDASGEAFNPIASCSYLGILSLAKGFGKDAVYHVEPI
jgi:class 3 adenylate cyclase